MDAGLENVIRRALEDARAAGRDHLTHSEEAVRGGREGGRSSRQGLSSDIKERSMERYWDFSSATASREDTNLRDQ